MLDGIDACFEKQDCVEDDFRVGYLPTPAEIRARCAQIRSEWSCGEERRRFVGTHPDDKSHREWTPPVVDMQIFHTGKEVDSGTMGGNH